MHKLIGIIFLGLLNMNVFAQDANLRDPCIFPQRVTMKNANLLQDILKDENVSLKIKACTLDWVRELYELEEDKAKPHAQEFYGIASNFLDNYKNDGAFTMNEEIRSSSCYLMAALENTGQKTVAIQKIKKAINEDRSYQVVQNCINAIGNLKGSKTEALSILTEIVEKKLLKEDINSEDIKMMSQLVTMVGRLEHKGGYIALMKVMQSGYPKEVKDATRRAILKMR